MSGKYSAAYKILIWIFLGIETILYGLLIYIDLFSFHSLGNSKMIKYTGILCCFLFVLISYWFFKIESHHISHVQSYSIKQSVSDSKLLIVIFIGTLLADWCILLSDDYILGVSVFCIVQLLYLYRIDRIMKVRFRNNLAVFGILIVIFIFLSNKIDVLLFLSGFYGVGIIGNGLRGMGYLKTYGIRKRRETFFFFGLILFLFCDMNVAIYNMGMYISVNNDFFRYIEEVAKNLIWIFYLPSQVLISLSVPLPHE